MDAGGRATQDAKAEGARRAGEGKVPTRAFESTARSPDVIRRKTYHPLKKETTEPD